jgi:hypothetical protein
MNFKLGITYFHSLNRLWTVTGGAMEKLLWNSFTIENSQLLYPKRYSIQGDVNHRWSLLRGSLINLLRLREAHTNQNSRLLDIMMSITHDSNCSWLHHHQEWEIHSVAEPSLCECSQDVAMSDLSELGINRYITGREGLEDKTYD